MPEQQDPYETLLSAELNAEEFVRQALGLLESNLREVALLSLQDWSNIQISSPSLFHAVAALQRPSWGVWNGVINDLRKARTKTLRSADAETREKINNALVISGLLERLDKNIKTPETESWFKQLHLNPTQTIPRKLTLQHLLSAPITLRNRIAHDTPTSAEFWEQSAKTLKQMIVWFNENSDLPHFCKQSAQLSPWFIHEDNETLHYNGINKQSDAALYLSSRGISQHKENELSPVLLTFQQLMGKTELQDKDFRRLLGKLAPDDTKGVFMGDYLVGKYIGEGAHGIVHKGIQLSTGRQVAIKFLKDNLSDEVVLRFKQEAEFLARFNHPNIVNNYGYGEDPWVAPKAFSLEDEDWYKKFKKSSKVKTYIAMEWIEGQTLDDYYQHQIQKKTPIDFDTLTQWFIDAATALEHVHQSDIIHRDIKPSNLMIDENGHIKLMDFGIARSYENLDARFTIDPKQLGTPAYMSPEQISAKNAEEEVGPAADVYGLTAVFYELYTKKRLHNHSKETTLQDFIQITNEKRLAKDPRKLNPNIPWQLNTILTAGLEREVADRYQEIKSLKQDLLHYQNNEPIEKKRPSIFRRMQLGYRRNRNTVNVALASVMVIIGATILYIHNVTQERNKAISAEKATKEQMLESNYQLAKSFEQKALLALEKGDKDQEEGGLKSVTEYRKAWLYALESRKLKIPKNKASLKSDTLSRVSDISSRAISPERKQTSSVPQYNVDNIIAYSPNGSNIATVEANFPSFIRLWNAKTGVLVKQIEASHSKSIAFSPDGNTLAIGDTLKSEIYLLNVKTGKIDKTLEGEESKCQPEILAYSPNGKMLVSSSQDEVVCLWSTKTSTIHKVIEGDFGRLHTLAYKPDGSEIASSSDSSILLWDANSGLLRETIDIGKESGSVNSISYSKDGNTLAYTTLHNKAVFLWDLKNKKVIEKLIPPPPHSETTLDYLKYSPNGDFLAVGGFSRNIIFLWNLKSKELMKVLKSPSRSFKNFEFSPDSKTIVTSNLDFWDIESGEIDYKKYDGHHQGIDRLIFTGDGLKTISISSDKSVRLWDSKSGSLIKSLQVNYRMLGFGSTSRYSIVPNQTSAIIAYAQDSEDKKNIRVLDIGLGKEVSVVSFSGKLKGMLLSNDSKLIASFDDKNNISLKNTYTNNLIMELKNGSDGYIQSMLFSPDNKNLAVVIGHNDKNPTLNLWDIESGIIAKTFKNINIDSVQKIIFSPDGKQLAITEGAAGIGTWGTKGAVHIWDVEKEELLQSWKDFSDDFDDIIYSPDGNTLVTSSKYIKFWDVKTGKLRHTFVGNYGRIKAMAYSPDGTTIVSGGEDQSLRFWDTQFGKIKHTVLAHKSKQSSPIASLAYHPEGKMLATGGGSLNSHGILTFWEPNTGRVMASFSEYSNTVTALDFSPDGATLASGSFDRTVTFWDLSTGDAIHTLDAKNPVSSVAYHPDGRSLAVGELLEIVQVWNTKTGTRKLGLAGHTNEVADIKFSPDGLTLASASADRKILLRNSESGEIEKTLTGHTSTIFKLAYSPDNTTLASAAGDKTIRLWNTKTGQQKRILSGHSEAVRSLAYSPDGSILASGSEDKTIRLWDAETGSLQRVLYSYSGDINNLEFNPISSVLTSTSENSIRFWDSSQTRVLDLFNDFDPKEVSNALQFLWELGLDPETGNFTRKKRTPTLYPKKDYYYHDTKYRSLLDSPKVGESKIDQLFHWLEEECAYESSPRKTQCLNLRGKYN